MKYLYTLGFLLLSALLFAQNDLDDMLADLEGETTEIVQAPFKASRLVTGHSVKQLAARELDVRIHHRFGSVSEDGAYDLFGLDHANILLSLEYGLSDRATLGAGRTSLAAGDKSFYGYAKLAILKQQKGARTVPVYLNYLSSVAYNTERGHTNYMAYVHQLLIARKVNKGFSLQLMPTYLHRNVVFSVDDRNDLFAVGAGGRVKLTQRISFNMEYYHTLRPKQTIAGQRYYHPISVGFDLETGGHVFQLLFTNNPAMIERDYLSQTTHDFFSGDIMFGFNVSRMFAL